ncbi:hypothetical protein P3438_22150 [Vibrio parahaemolyticus]|uniref:hypothetical protein n=2 Tax=Vibrio parahaemolyticus TaxID=670 RepID=UPI0012F74A40|nr:hypothetical protein [Vibrio parahaemolyticus]ELA8137664.1 hypothetical protein [Vibrio parahaemolyticus]MDF4476191.1 hypothetical protein [Vibrio parahaemolyticus]MDF4480674.1 hypothetical protein [Vibrio parahaemolyticus]MDG3409092.1 hypothetical protein [Vibrio parahaemolyticus]MUT64081.1 hypothetical protein [Vibrio parahaemolyticus]
MKKIDNLTDVLWSNEPFSDDPESFNTFVNAYQKAECLLYNKRFSLFTNELAYLRLDRKNQLLHHQEQAGVLELMLGLTSGPNMGLKIFEEYKWITPDYSCATGDIILNRSDHKKIPAYFNDYFFVNPHLSLEQRSQDHHDYLISRTSDFFSHRYSGGPQASDGIQDQTFPVFDVIRQVPKFDGHTKFWASAVYLVAPKKTETLPEKNKVRIQAISTNQEKKYGFVYRTYRLYTYQQPTSQLVGQYTRFRQYWFAYQEYLKENFEEVKCPHEDSVIEYLEWVKQALSYLEQPQSNAKPGAFSHALSSTLSKSYPGVPDVIDYFHRRMEEVEPNTEKDKGYTVKSRPNLLLDRLIEGIKSLRKRPYDYFNDQTKTFHEEEIITVNLCRQINGDDKLTKDLEATDAKSKIDLLLHCKDTDAELAVESKIAFKDNKVRKGSQEIPKALFVQAEAYATRLRCNACVVLYILDGDLMKVTQAVVEIVKKEAHWSISPKKGEQGSTHYVLRKTSKSDDVKDILIDVLFVCLDSKSNTEKSREKSK